MTTILNYTILKPIYESPNSLVYRALRNDDQRPVILKWLKTDFPAPMQLIRYQHEYELLRQLNLPGVIQAYCLEKVQNTFILVLEDFGGESLREYLKQRAFSLQEWLALAIAIADSLGQLHATNIIHKDLNPSNIVWNPATQQVKLIDFGIATQLPRENPVLQSPEQLEGTLAYLSPEQTGRMNRSLDYRTDLYSLGVTFYELLTNHLPFDCQDAMELVHCHLAKQPLPPHELNPKLPTVISQIVRRLMAKMAEERYQSAWGVKADLEKVQEQWHGKNWGHFQLGQFDQSDKFQVPQKLYGRDQEVEKLLQAFSRVNHGQTEILLVAGYSGIGKTSLIQEIYKPITASRGYFIAGKFDQFQRNIPYSALVSALTDLVRQLLTESEVRLSQWRQQLLVGLGVNGQVMVDMIPELEWIIGPQPAVPSLEPTEAQNRFNLVFQNFLRVFGQQPLVIFLDDLQWADLATLKLLELLVRDAQTTYLLIVGAYRDNEVDAVHPLKVMLDRLTKTSTVVEQITLPPLQLEHITQLLIETLHRNVEEVQSLATLVMQKTQGNPFFVNQFLKTLFQEQLLSFDIASRQWQWDLAQLTTLNITDNVVDLMIGKLKKLPPATQDSLRLAACIGNRFGLSMLALMSETTPSEVVQSLWPALQEELILPATTDTLSESHPHSRISHYKFAHDRIQQAAYALIPDRDKPQVHLRVGKLLLNHTAADELEERIFEIVHHLNFGLVQEKAPVERRLLVKLNTRAGKRARQSAAYAATLEYLEIAARCLEADAWQVDYDFTRDLYKSYAEAEFLNSHFDQATRLIALLEENVKSNLEKAEMLLLLVVQQTIEAKYVESVNTTRQALKWLNFDLPTSETVETATQQVFAEVKTHLGDREISSLKQAPENQNPVYQLAIKLYISLEPSVYIMGDLNLYMYVSVKAVALSLQYGNIAESAKGYSNYGLILGSGLGDFQSGYQFGVLAVEVSKKFNSLAYECKADLLLANWIHSWSRHIRAAKRYNLDGIHAGMEAGELQFVGYQIYGYITNWFVEGSPLSEVQSRIEEYIPTLNKLKNDGATDGVLGIQLAVYQLTGRGDKIVRYGDVLAEPDYLPICQPSAMAYAPYCTFKAQALYLLEQPEMALQVLDSAKSSLGGMFGFTASLEYNFYHSLILLALFERAPDPQREEYLKIITANQTQLKKWADNCPDNFLHRWLLVEAELARVNGQNFAAVELYDRAIELAGQYEFIQNQALANELAAKFWLQKDKQKIAKIYLQEACHGYTVWGATRKVADLLKIYPLLFLKTTSSTVMTSQPSPHGTVYATSMPVATMIGQSAEQVLDLTTLMKVSQALSGEIWLHRLLERLMHTVIENAGAQRGSLVLKQHDDWVIEAQGANHQDSVTVLQSLPLAGHLPLAVINYVMRTKQPVVIANAQTESLYRADDYIRTQQVKSLLCLPIVYQQKLVGMIYLENNLAAGVFTPNRLQLLTLLTSQIAISLENARFVVELDQARQAEAQARQVAETANYTKTAFLANVTHELRTPLNGILGYTQLLLQDSQLTTEQQDAVKVIHRSGEHLLTLVSDILEISKLQTAQLELHTTDLHLSKFLTNLVAVFRDQAQHKGLTFQYEPAAGLPRGIVVDEKRLRQILLHLLSNAVKFTHRYGHITFQVHSDPVPDSPGCYHFHFVITDTGCGIATTDLERIFVPFEQVSDWRQKSAGAGLGLSLTKQLVELMGGQLEVSSQVGQGSTFTVHLALTESTEWQGVVSAEQMSDMEETSCPPVVESDLPWKEPSAEKATELFEAAQNGDFFGILELVAQLEQEDAELRPFVAKVRKFAKNYQDESICELVQQIMIEQKQN